MSQTEVLFYIVFYVHDDYDGDTTLWRCAKPFKSWEAAQQWVADNKLNVIKDVKTWQKQPSGFDEDDLNCIETTVTNMVEWIETLQKKAVELENYKEEERVEDDEDDENPDPG